MDFGQKIRTADFLHRLAQSQGGGDEKDQLPVERPHRVAHADDAGRDHEHGTGQGADRDRHDPGRGQGDDTEEDRPGALRVMGFRQFLRGPFHQQHIVMAAHFLDIFRQPLQQQSIASFQANLGQALPQQVAAPLNTDHDAMMGVAETHLLQGLSDYA